MARYLVHGFIEGFDVGYRGRITHSQPHNLQSALKHPEEVTTALNKEVKRGHTLGPFISPPFLNLHTSPLGAVPKKDGTYRLILDLSYPEGTSINDGIDHDEFSVTYTAFDEATKIITSLGPGSYIKIDIKQAFRLCPVRPADYPLLGIYWNGEYYVDTRLPFGSRSSPFIFNTFADALCWILITVGGIAHIIHYLDDFFMASKDHSSCSQVVKIVSIIFEYLGIPIATDKLYILDGIIRLTPH